MRTGVSEISHGQALLEPQTISASVALSTDRITGIDRLRILAAIGIVWFHTEGAPYREVGYAGLPVFLLIFFSLIARQEHPGTTGQFLRRRYSRLLKPWLFWSAVYGLCRLAKALHAMNVPELWEMFSLETLVMGTSIHLWYLPYAFVSGLLTFEINRRTLQINHLIVAVAAAVVGMLTLAVSAIAMAHPGMPSPLPQWTFGLTAIPLGLAIGRSLSIQSQALRRALLAVICLALLVESGILQLLGLEGMTIPYGIAIVAVCLAYGWETGNDPMIATLAPLTFGVYLIHPLVSYALRSSLPTGIPCSVYVSLVVGVSALIAWVLLRTPIKRFL